MLILQSKIQMPNEKILSQFFFFILFISLSPVFALDAISKLSYSPIGIAITEDTDREEHLQFPVHLILHYFGDFI